MQQTIYLTLQTTKTKKQLQYENGKFIKEKEMGFKVGFNCGTFTRNQYIKEF